jgi:MFS family permease
MVGYILIYFGQLVSLIGSELTSFALGIWVYQHTGSVTQFSLISLFTMLPGLVISPVAGAFVDRSSRRWTMILCNCGAGLSIGVLALLLITGQLQVWYIYLIVAAISVFNAYHWLAYSAAITLLVPNRHFGRASGMTQMGEAVAKLIAPILAGVLLVTIHLQGIILLDFASFLFAIVTLVVVSFPEVKTANEKATKHLLLQEAAYGWSYITARPGLLGLLVFFVTTNFTVSIAEVLVTPLVLSFTSATVLGKVLSLAGSGMLMGSLVMSVWGGPKRRVYGVFGGELLLGLCLVLMGLRRSVNLIIAAGFLAFFAVPIIVSSSQAIWQSKVAPYEQGRVFAVRRMLAWSSRPLAYLIAGPLADHVFEPLMLPKTLLAGSIGQLIGVGRGRGIGLLFSVMGLLTILTTVIAYQYQCLRLVEDELPDAVADNASFRF